MFPRIDWGIGLRIVVIVGTRPEAIKMAPVVRMIRGRAAMTVQLIATGQHGALFDDALRPFGLQPDHRLEMPDAGASPEEMVASMQAKLIPMLGRLSPDLVLVQGDTSSALAAARAATARGIPVGHVEAGLRSHDLARPWPEEGNRIAIDRLATLLFAPTEGNLANLAADPEIGGKAYLTGNSGIDALRHIRAFSPSVDRSGDERRRIMVTLHRREVIGAPLSAICRALRRIAERPDIAITMSMHPNPRVRQIVTEELGNRRAITLVEPLSYPDMIVQMRMADLILSDSGGVQEEAPALGVPLLILRDVTERPEAVDCGAAVLAGTDPDAILAEVSRLTDDPEAWRTMAVPRFPFGRGDAARKIVTVIENYGGSQNVT